MNYQNISVPFLNNTKIKHEANLFRQKFWDDSIPVDIETIIDVKLKINIIPTTNLKSSCDTDAFITPNWQSIYVDNHKFLDERYQNRLRFSFAHEIGHFVLHQKIYSNFNIKNVENFYECIKQIPQKQYEYIEAQANKFANYLLAPRDKLIVEKIKILKKTNDDYNLEKVDINTLNSYLAIPISKIFGVSSEVIEIALNQMNDN